MENSAKIVDIDPYRKKVVRQGRVELENFPAYLSLKAKKYKIRDYSSFGLSIYAESDCPFESCDVAEIEVYGVVVCSVDLKYVRSQVDSFGSHFHAYSVHTMPVDCDALKAACFCGEILHDHEKAAAVQQQLPQNFLASTLQIQDWLQSLEKQVNSIQPNQKALSVEEFSSFEDVVCQFVSSYLDKNLKAHYVELAKAIEGLSKDEIQHCFSFFRDRIGAFMYQSYYANRAFEKPLGYAGDFEMMNTVYKRENRGEGLFAKAVHRYFVEVPEARAVRNRANYLVEKIEQTLVSSGGNTKILSVACGPAEEVRRTMEKHPHLFSENTEIHLLDQDESALQYSQKKTIMTMNKFGIKSKLILHRNSIKKVIERGLELKGFDLIYSAGLFDYLSDPVAHFAAQRLWNSVKSSGKLIVGNFNVNNPNEFGMGLIMDWHLIYRSEADMEKLFKNITSRLVIEKEGEGINLFAVMHKNEN